MEISGFSIIILLLAGVFAAAVLVFAVGKFIRSSGRNNGKGPGPRR